MKRFIFVFMTLFTMFSFVSYGQNVTLTQEQYNMLPQNVKDEINFDKKIDKTSKYVSWGKEIGVAIDETLKAIGNNALKISETSLGKIAIGVALFKLLAKDIVLIIMSFISIILLIFYIQKLFKFLHEIREKYSNIDSFNYPDSAKLIINIIVCFVFLFMFIVSTVNI